ncbi:MAG: inositol monophosphatase family protein [Myxococcota bacterium]|nr:inositol monophosphatase family protein [Myxococcota bacterium]
MSDLEADLELAHGLVDQASEIALRYFESGTPVRTKADGSPVTAADVEVERCLVETLRRERPDDGVLGEEGGAVGSSRRRWILDPIDGTMNFVAGTHQWGSHVALEEDGEIRLGVISRPTRSLRWWALRGGGAHRAAEGALHEAQRLRVSETSRLADARITVWAKEPHPDLALLRDHVRFIPPDLDAILDLAEGRLEAVVDPGGQVWDHAPALVLVEEAGGRMSDREGGRRIDRGNCRYSNGRVHDELVALLDRLPNA